MGRLLCGVAEQLAEGRTSKPRLLSRGFDSRTYALGHISELVGSTKKLVQRRYRGLRWLLAERCCEMRSVRWAKSQHAGVARSKQVSSVLAWVGSFAGLYFKRYSARPTSLTSRLVRTQFGRPQSRGAKLRGAASSARSPRLPSMCHVRGDQQEAPAVSLL